MHPQLEDSFRTNPNAGHLKRKADSPIQMLCGAFESNATHQALLTILLQIKLF